MNNSKRLNINKKNKSLIIITKKGFIGLITSIIFCTIIMCLLISIFFNKNESYAASLNHNYVSSNQNKSNSEYEFYIIKSGETIWELAKEISKKYTVDIRKVVYDIQKINNINDFSKIKPNTIIKSLVY